MAVYFILISLCRSLFDKKKFYKMYGNISSFTKDDYLKKNPRFALFLRGFQDDEYTPLADIEEGSEFASFSEYHFIKLLERRIPVCALGWEKELDSPYGASRIYVDNNTWKSDVLELMIKADEIYILVNDRENCIWEIGQTKRMLDKTTFIIDQKQKYENARNALADIINLPELPENSKFYHHQILRYQDNRYYFFNYDNSIEQYSQMLGIPKSKRKMKTIYHKGCFLIVLIIFLSILLDYLVSLSIIPFKVFYGTHYSKT